MRSICYIDAELEGKIASTGFSVLTPNNKIHPELLNSALSANYFINSVVKNSVGTSYPAITDEKLLNLRLAIPATWNEQETLVSEIKNKTSSIEEAIQKLKIQLKLLVELKNREMLDAVLGNVDLRNFVVPEYSFDIEEEIDDFDDESDEEV